MQNVGSCIRRAITTSKGADKSLGLGVPSPRLRTRHISRVRTSVGWAMRETWKGEWRFVAGCKRNKVINVIQ